MAINIEELEKAVSQLSSDQLQKFRAWFEDFDAQQWDQQITSDSDQGKLDALADAALAEHQAGKSRKL